MPSLKLPDRDQAVSIMVENDLTTLALDGWAHIKIEQPKLAELFEIMVAENKINAENLTGASLLVGLILQTRRV